MRRKKEKANNIEMEFTLPIQSNLIQSNPIRSNPTLR
jgi:hypothetical protein